MTSTLSVFTTFSNPGVARISTWKGREKKGKKRKGEKKRLSTPLCFVAPQPTIGKNSVFDARHNKSGLCAGASRKGLSLFLGEAPKACFLNPMNSCYAQLLVYPQSHLCILEFISGYSLISYATNI